MNKVAVVTGAGAGVGRCIAISLAKKGYNLIVVGRSEENTLETARIVSEYTNVYPEVADVGSEEDTKRYISTAIEKFGRIDILAHSAARFQPYKAIGETDSDLFDDIIKTNVRGTFLAMKYAIKEMEKQGEGRIVVVGSKDGLISDACHGSYSASKHAVIGLVKNAAVEYGGKGIRVNCVCPASINTKMIKDILDVIDPSVLGPMGRPAEPQEIAAVACYLASDEASFLNGAIINADGGYMI